VLQARRVPVGPVAVIGADIQSRMRALQVRAPSRLRVQLALQELRFVRRIARVEEELERVTRMRAEARPALAGSSLV
jgi:hypothetical protein